MSWLTDLVHQHREVESPQSFWFWSGLCAISAVVKDNVWVNRGGLYKLYPNIFVVLHAESGLKKGPPINLAQQLVKNVNNTNIISGRASIQAIMKRLSEAKTSPGGKVITKSTGFICASELSSSIVEDPAALTILTDLYDRNYRTDDWESLLKMDTFKLRDPTVSLLGGINDAHAEQFFTNKDIQGGFLARTFVIYEKAPNTINSLALPMENPPDVTTLSKHLKELTNLQGQFENFWSDKNTHTPVGKFYNEWYHSFTTQRMRSEVKDETGTLNRFGDSVIKIAMLLSLSRTTDLQISIGDMEQAIEVGEKLIGNIRETTMNRKGHSNSAPLKGMIIKKLLERETHSISRVALMKDMYLHYSDVNEFDGIISSFASAGLITIGNIGSQVVYTMVAKEVEHYQKLIKGKMR
jgi:hypothetical protein